MQSPYHLSGILFAIIGTGLFALKSIFIKLAYAEGATAEPLLMLRMGLGAPFYLGMLFYVLKNAKYHELPSLILILRMLLLGLLGYYLASYLDLLSLELISAQLERLTLYTYPTMIAILAALLLGEKMTAKIIAALVVTYFGVFIMYAKEKTLMQGEDITTGVILVLGAALSYSLYVIFSKPVIQKIGSRFFTSVAMLGSTFYVAISFSLTNDFSEVIEQSPIVWFYGLILALFCTFIPSYLISESIVRIGAAKTTIVGTAGPVFTMILAIILLNEPTSYQHIIGMLVVISGVALATRK